MAMDYEEVKIVVSPYSGRLFVRFDDGSMLPINTMLGEAYIDYHLDWDKEDTNAEKSD